MINGPAELSVLTEGVGQKIISLRRVGVSSRKSLCRDKKSLTAKLWAKTNVSLMFVLSSQRGERGG